MANGRFFSLAEKMLLHARRTPDKRAFVCDGAPLSYSELAEKAAQCAARFQALGLQPGGDRRIGVLAPNSSDVAIILAACQLAGLAFVPLPLLIAPDAQARMIADANVTLLFHDHAFKAQAEAAVGLLDGQRPSLQAIATPDAPPLDQWLAGESSSFTPVTIEAEWTSDLIYSSGTTGIPKGIVQNYGGRAASCAGLASLGVSVETNFLHTIGLYSNFGMVGALLSLWWGGTYFMMRKFTGEAVVDTLLSERIDMAWFAPATMIRTVETPRFDEAVEGRPCVKLCAGAPLSQAHKRQVLDRWSGPFYDLYGQTETGTISLLPMHASPDDKLGSIGLVLPTVDVVILDDNGNGVAPGREGEIAAHTSSMMTGYHQREDANAAALWRDSTGKTYLRTGDIGRLDEDRYLWLCDRKKDMILSGGINIYPADIERAFGDHPAVFEAAAVGCPSDRWGESPVAFVTLKDGAPAAEDELRDWVNARLGSIQRVAAVKVLKELPNGTMGKILKRELRRKFVQDMGTLP